MSASARIQDLEYLYASNTNVSNFVSVRLSSHHNYLVWKAQMLCLLDSNNMGGIVDATFVGPRYSGTEIVRQYDCLARGWILGSVSEDILVDVYHLTSAKAVWEKLKSICDPAMCLQGDSASKQSNAKTKTKAKDLDAVVSTETNTTEEDASSIEIIVGEDRDQTETKTKNEDTQKSGKKSSLREAILKGKWLEAESILRKDKGLATEVISSDGSTILHMAVGIGHNDIVKNLIPYINNEEILQKRDSDGSTALHIAAIVGNKDAAGLLVNKNSKLLRITDSNGKEPLHKAYENMHLDTVRFLLDVDNYNGDVDDKLPPSSPDPSHSDDEIGIRLLVNAISAKKYGLALELVKRFPKFASKKDDALMALAKTFPRGLDYWETLIYPSTDHWRMITQPIHDFWVSLMHTTNSVRQGFPLEVLIVSCLITFVLALVLFMLALPFLIIIFFIPVVCSSFRFLYSVCWKGATKVAVPPIKHIENKKKEWDEAEKLLYSICGKIDWFSFSARPHPYYRRPILEAACQNAYKVVEGILDRSPKSINSTDKNGYDIIQLAILHRSERVYNIIYDIGEHKNKYRTMVDSSKNNILHLVGRLAPSNVLGQRTGAALQLQRELQWREEVKELVFPTYVTQENIFKETPDMVFTREHKDLVKEGEQWMKTTAESCSITAALITTIVFAAAITIPGGSNQEKGTPLLKKESAFIIFAIADAISLFASSTALLVFLSILTARFAERDFLVSLPRRLFIGLFSLLVSTTTMMVAFSATLFLVFCDGKLWMLAPICGLAFIPIAFFVGLQFPLMVDLLSSTYLPIFGKKRRGVIT